MRIRGKRCLALLISALLLFYTNAALGAAIAPRTAWDAQLTSLELSAGALNKKFQAGESSYEMTLGPQESGFTLSATPYETTYAPTMKLAVDGAGEEALAAGQASRFISVAPGQSRTVTVTSAPYNSPSAPQNTYTIQVYRTTLGFTWTPEVVERSGSRFLDVTLSASGGTKLKTLMFALGFDPARLQTADTSVLNCIRAVDNNFFYSSANPAGYFELVAQTVKNDTGVLAVQYGVSQKSTSPYYTVPGAAGKSSALFTVSFKLAGDAALDGSVLKVLTAEDSRSVNPGTGISVMEARSSGTFGVSACPGMVSIAGQSSAEIGRLTVKNPAERQLVWTDNNGVESFLFQPDEKDYRLYLLPDENGFELELYTFDDVKHISLNGEALTAESSGTVAGAQRWVRAGTGNLAVSLSELQLGEVVLTLDRGETGKSAYIITVEQMTKETCPDIILHQDAADRERYVAEIRNAQFRTASLELLVRGVEESDVAGLSAPDGLVLSKAVLTRQSGDYDKLEITLDTNSAAPYEGDAVLELFSGKVGRDVKLSETAGNSIGDARFGGLYSVGNQAEMLPAPVGSITAQTVTNDSIELAALAVPAGAPEGAYVEYAMADASGNITGAYQRGTLFTGLSAGTGYRFAARLNHAETAGYIPSEDVLSGTITTIKPETPTSGGDSTTYRTVIYEVGSHGTLSEGSYATERVAHGSSPARIPTVVAEKGYLFVGWSLDGKLVDPSAVKVTKAVTFNAMYEKGVVVSYEAGAHGRFSAGTVTYETVRAGSTPAAAPTPVADSGYLFAGWMQGEQFVGSGLAVNADVTYVAYYTTGSVSFNKALKTPYIQGFEANGQLAFKPTDTLTRGQAAAILARIVEQKKVQGKDYVSGRFSDLTGSEWYAEDIGFMAELGVMKGYSDGTCGGDRPVTRAELVTMVMRIDGLVETGGVGFADSESHWAKRYILSAAEKGYVGGYEDGSFRPDATIARAEVVKIINRMLGWNWMPTGKMPFNDVPEDYWAYADILRASTGK